MTPASKPGAGARDHWEGSPCYGNEYGKEWFELNRTVDEGYTEEIEDQVSSFASFKNIAELDLPEVGDSYFYQNLNWIIDNVGIYSSYNDSNGERICSGAFELYRIITKQVHHPVFYDYWNVYEYSFFNWNYIREERREAS